MFINTSKKQIYSQQKKCMPTNDVRHVITQFQPCHFSPTFTPRPWCLVVKVTVQMTMCALGPGTWVVLVTFVPHLLWFFPALPLFTHFHTSTLVLGVKVRVQMTMFALGPGTWVVLVACTDFVPALSLFTHFYTSTLVSGWSRSRRKWPCLLLGKAPDYLK